MENSQQVQNQPERARPQPDKHKVQITINGEEYRVEKGIHTVAELKRIGGVSPADVLEQIVHKKLVALPDDGSVDIKGHEIFVSHVRDCGSS